MRIDFLRVTILLTVVSICCRLCATAGDLPVAGAKASWQPQDSEVFILRREHLGVTVSRPEVTMRKTLEDLDTIIPNSEISKIPKIGLPAFAVYSVIRKHADYTTGISYPTTATLMTMTGIGSINTIRKIRELLRTEGLLTYEFRKARRLDGSEYGRDRFFYTLTNPAVTLID